ncbi:prolyl oligopeptidase family serine peptidase [Actinoplanes sp. NBRC 103695]|uniref:prolyl oligopeptidase family serine peptidase n=1 Tax=Actinoplanes sp. NBRC 103695 TaxID=3032202 RepID=UPI0024A0E4CE|nr:prolyl oligopeptidase family serine peptidase [Actinoplanes sp. NBRC 103695]GLY95738.1 dipeptidyl-peptidase 4 [Actinoplanes sp. NBRC 103695]
MDFPDLARRTGGFRHGAPHDVMVGGDGARVVFLRSAGRFEAAASLWVLSVTAGVEQQVAPGPVERYGVDRDATVAAYAIDGRLFRADLRTGDVTAMHTEAPAIDPHPDPAGASIGYTTPDGCLRIAGPDGSDELLAGEPGDSSWRDPGGVRWGVTDPAGLEFGRRRGWWWSPDGAQVLASRTAGSISLHLLDLDGGWVDVHWDRETYPYLVDVHWGDGGNPLITVLRRLQQHGLVLSVDPRTGETQVHAELADARWVEPVAGTPRHLPDGRVLVGGELAHDGFDARCLFADGSLLTPPGLYVRRVIGVLPGAELVVEATEGDPATSDIFRVRGSLGGGGASAERVAVARPAAVGGDVLVIGEEVRRDNRVVHRLRSSAEPLPYSPRPILERVTDRRLPASVLYPPDHVGGTRLPVLLTFGDGPGHQQVTQDPAGWQERAWWAGSGFAVVSVDPRGTPGLAPSFEKAVHRRLADVTLADVLDALRDLTGKHPDLDIGRVAAHGAGLGGWLAGLAVVRRGDEVRCGVARDPVTDWHDLPAPLAERYLGRATDAPEMYAHHALTAELPHPALLITDSSDLEAELTFVREQLR